MLTKPLIALLILLLPAPASIAASMALEFIQLNNRQSNEIIPLLKPFLLEGSTLTGQDYQLIVRTTPENLATLKAIVSKFDKAQAQLLITISHDSERVRNDQSIGLTGTFQHSPAVRLQRTRRHSDQTLDQQVTVLEGGQAWIETGQAIPVVSQSGIDDDGNRYGSIQYQPVTSGFYVRPTLHGDQVELEVFTHRDNRHSIGYGNINTQSASTTMQVRLGEWITLGGTQQSETTRGQAITRYQTHRNRDQQTIYIKVERLQQ